MTKEEKDQLDALTLGLGTLVKSFEGIQASVAELLKKPVAAASIAPMVTTHCAALRECAAKMAAAGIGMAGAHGHVAILQRMADAMEAEAAAGRLPHIYRDHDYLSSYASADKDEIAKQIKAAADAQAESMKASVEALLTPFKDTLASLGTKITDIGKKVETRASADGEATRKTLSPGVTQALERMGLHAGGEDGKSKIKVSDFDNAAQKAGLDRQRSMTMKLELRAAGLLEGNS